MPEKSGSTRKGHLLFPPLLPVWLSSSTYNFVGSDIVTIPRLVTHRLLSLQYALKWRIAATQGRYHSQRYVYPLRLAALIQRALVNFESLSAAVASRAP